MDGVRKVGSAWGRGPGLWNTPAPAARRRRCAAATRPGFAGSSYVKSASNATAPMAWSLGAGLRDFQAAALVELAGQATPGGESTSTGWPSRRARATAPDSTLSRRCPPAVRWRAGATEVPPPKSRRNPPPAAAEKPPPPRFFGASRVAQTRPKSTPPAPAVNKNNSSHRASPRCAEVTPPTRPPRPAWENPSRF